MDIPTLPDIGLKEENAKINPWLETYIEYATARSPMTPRLFHESAGLWLLSTAVARRAKIILANGDNFPNLFMCWIAGTTVWNKTTALSIAKRIAVQNFPHLIAPHEVTPEALLTDLAGIEPAKFTQMPESHKELWYRKRDYCAQKSMIIDEMSSLLSANTRDYYAGLFEIIMQMFDCSEMYDRLTRAQGYIVVRDTYMSFIGASTPAALSPFFKNDRLWTDGWWSRFALLCPEGDHPEWVESQVIEQPPEIAAKLVSINRNLPTWSWGKEHTTILYSIDKDAFNLWKKYDQLGRSTWLEKCHNVNEKIHGTYGRLPAQAIRIAMLLALLDWSGREIIRIGVQHVTKAIHIAESWRMSAHRVLELADITEEAKLEGRVCNYLSTDILRGHTFRDARRAFSGVTVKDLKVAFQNLIDMGTVTTWIPPITSNGGNPGLHYKLVS